MKRRGRKRTNKLLSAIIIALVLSIVAFLQGKGIIPKTVNPNADGNVYLHVIDVDQGSATLIQQGDEGILIDAGEADYGQEVSKYINSCGINSLKYVVASHPHSDHIGGLPAVLKNFNIGEVLMPEIDEDNLPVSRVYERFLDTIIDENITASYCEVDDSYRMGDVTMRILGPVEQIDDLNNMSAICRITVGNTDVMIPGDAESKELRTVCRHGGNFESEILIMGHHGSCSSLYYDFLSAVDPIDAVISCGTDNSYGHPHEETIDYLMQNNIEYYRTDYSGNIVYLLTDEYFERVER